MSDRALGPNVPVCGPGVGRADLLPGVRTWRRGVRPWRRGARAGSGRWGADSAQVGTVGDDCVNESATDGVARDAHQDGARPVRRDASWRTPTQEVLGMWVQDVRMPPEPAVPVVIRPDSGASTRMETFAPSQGAYDRQARRRPGPAGDLEHLTDADLDLVYAVTGETVWRGEVRGGLPGPVTGFTRQLAIDRRTGALPAHREVTAAYLVRTGSVIEANGGVNPYSGAHLERALAYLASRGQGRVDIIC